jgi:hypothetical protein
VSRLRHWTCWLRAHLLGPRMVTFPDRLAMISTILVIIVLLTITYKELHDYIDNRARSSCTSIGADLALYSLIQHKVRLAPADRVVLDRSLAAKRQLQQQLQCPNPPKSR